MDPVPATVWGTSAAERLAQRLEQDIRQRGLQPGDRYMTAAATGRALNVSRAATNRAMALMAERRLLVRHRKQGSFVGPGFKRSAALGAPTVYILTAAGIPEALGTMPADEVIRALRRAIGSISNIQFCFLPDGRELSHLRKVIQSGHDSGARFGVIAQSSTRPVYQCLIDHAAPTVVLGTPYAGQHDLPSIDYDHLQGGRLVMQYLIRRGHDRMAMLMTMGASPGDSDFLRGLNNAMSETTRLPNTLDVTITPADPIGIAAEVENLMAQPDRATALIATTEQIGRITIDTVSDMGLSVPGDVEVVFENRRPE